MLVFGRLLLNSEITDPGIKAGYFSLAAVNSSCIIKFASGAKALIVIKIKQYGNKNN
jgi:hypothetical protein